MAAQSDLLDSLSAPPSRRHTQSHQGASHTQMPQQASGQTGLYEPEPYEPELPQKLTPAAALANEVSSILSMAFVYLVAFLLLRGVLPPQTVELITLSLQCAISFGLRLKGHYHLSTLAAIGALVSRLSVLLFQ